MRLLFFFIRFTYTLLFFALHYITFYKLSINTLIINVFISSLHHNIISGYFNLKDTDTGFLELLVFYTLLIYDEIKIK